MDGRTDGQDRARHWKTAVFDSGENFSGQFDALLNHKPPGWKVYTKLEICPDTGREHYQTHVDCGRSERLSALSKWIKHTKWFQVKGEQHIKNSISYVHKEDTTAPGASVITLDNERYMRLHELLMAIAQSAWRHPPVIDEDLKSEVPNPYGCSFMEQYSFKKSARFLIMEDLRWIDKLSNPMVAKMWNDFGDVIIQKLHAIIEEQGEPFIIEGSPDTEEIPNPERFFLDDDGIDEGVSSFSSGESSSSSSSQTDVSSSSSSP